MCSSVFKECKFVVKEKKEKFLKYITDDIEMFSDDSDREYCGEEVSNEENSDEENSNEEN